MGRVLKPVWVGLLLISIGIFGVVEAQAVADPDVIATRQVGYDLAQGTVNGMRQAVAAKLDPKPYAEGAAAIARWGKLIPSLFPEGSETGGKPRRSPRFGPTAPGLKKSRRT